MDIETIALKLQETTDRSERNEGRIKKLEGEHEVLHQLATSVAVMAEKMDSMSKSLNTMSAKVDEIENKPSKRWDALVGNLISVLAGAFLAWLVSGAVGL